MEVYCYAQQCSSRNGGIVPQSEIDQWFDEHPDAPEGEDYCMDWDLVAWGTEEEIIAQCRKIIRDTDGSDSNAQFRRRQCRNVLEMLGSSESPVTKWICYDATDLVIWGTGDDEGESNTDAVDWIYRNADPEDRIGIVDNLTQIRCTEDLAGRVVNLGGRIEFKFDHDQYGEFAR